MTARNHPARHGGLIRPRHGGGNKALQPLPLMIGFLVGVVVMYTLMIPLNGSSRMDIMTTADGSSNSIGGGKDQWLVPAHKGWHPITVFFGTNAHDGLQIPPNQKWFSQVHQDEIVYGLLDGKRGYFIDLAANDAKEFSNTLALEQVGWDGKTSCYLHPNFTRPGDFFVSACVLVYGLLCVLTVCDYTFVSQQDFALSQIQRTGMDSVIER